MDGLEVTRQESPLGAWTSAAWRPAAGSPLDGAIDRVWYFDGNLGAARERVFPDGTLELIVQLDTPHRPGGDGAATPFPALCATGVRTTAEVVEAPAGRCRVLGVRLRPQAAFAVLGASLGEFASQTVDLTGVLGPHATQLGDRVHEAGDAAEAVRSAAAWAAARIGRGPGPDATVERTLRAIASDGGAGCIRALAGWEGRSRARFAAAFRDRVGVSPKRFARVVRFDRALRAIAQGGASLGEIALAAGYYDQAHFNADFREHAGLTPRAYVHALRYPGTTNVADGTEHFFQDAAS